MRSSIVFQASHFFPLQFARFFRREHALSNLHKTEEAFSMIFYLGITTLPQFYQPCKLIVVYFKVNYSFTVLSSKHCDSMSLESLLMFMLNVSDPAKKNPSIQHYLSIFFYFLFFFYKQLMLNILHDITKSITNYKSVN